MIATVLHIMMVCTQGSSLLNLKHISSLSGLISTVWQLWVVYSVKWVVLGKPEPTESDRGASQMPYGPDGIKWYTTTTANQSNGRTSTPCLQIVRQILLDESSLEST